MTSGRTNQPTKTTKPLETNVNSLFGSQDSGPSAAEIEADNLEAAKKRERDVRANAEFINSTGVTQLFGPGNPALNVPGGDSA